MVNAERPNTSYAGLYYSLDSGLTWSLARITDGATGDVQGPLDAFASPHGNAATAVVWNPIRRLFIAAIRYHGYYQSADGVIWTRMAVQPGMGLTPHSCPTNPRSHGSACVSHLSGSAGGKSDKLADTFAWTVMPKIRTRAYGRMNVQSAQDRAATRQLHFKNSGTPRHWRQIRRWVRPQSQTVITN